MAFSFSPVTGDAVVLGAGTGWIILVTAGGDFLFPIGVVLWVEVG